MASEHVGVGPDGANPLGFMAAVGAFTVLTTIRKCDGIRMSWRREAAWHPVWHVPVEFNEESIVDTIHNALSRSAEFGLGDDIKVTSEKFREFAQAAALEATDTLNRRLADFAAAFGCDAVTKQNGKTRLIENTRFCFTAGNQGFFAIANELRKPLSREDVRKALFQPWRYQDQCKSLRWDPIADDRQYALRAFNPTDKKNSPIMTDRAANLLAFEALACFPAVPAQGTLQTAGFVANRFVWPIWEMPITLPTLRSLLVHKELTEIRPDLLSLRRMGVLEIFQSERVRFAGYYGNFTPAVPVFTEIQVHVKNNESSGAL